LFVPVTIKKSLSLGISPFYIFNYCVLIDDKKERSVLKKNSLYKGVGLFLTKGREPRGFDQHLVIRLADFFYDQHLSSS
jgi:hypothetical protein